MADFFISASKERQNQFVLETHSEYLLLRILKRIKETTDGDQKNKSLRITPEDISVLYVEPLGGESIVREMPLNEQGELIRDWPGGFFEEGLREILL